MQILSISTSIILYKILNIFQDNDKLIKISILKNLFLPYLKKYITFYKKKNSVYTLIRPKLKKKVIYFFVHSQLNIFLEF